MPEQLLGNRILWYKCRDTQTVVGNIIPGLDTKTVREPESLIKRSKQSRGKKIPWSKDQKEKFKQNN